MSYQPIEVVSTLGMDRETWLEYRRKGIGGSDVAAILGFSPFCTARDIYYDKAGIKPAVQTEENWVALEYGHALEELVAKIFSFKTGYRVFKREILFAHPKHPFLQANVDYFYETPRGETGILECKTTDSESLEKWEDGAAPYNYELQCRHYLYIMGLQTAFIACLYGNNENKFLYRKIEQDPHYETGIVPHLEYFWNHHVLDNAPPPYTESGKLVMQSIQKYFGNGDPNQAGAVLDPKLIPVMKEYLRLSEKKKKAAKKLSDLENQLQQLSGVVADKMGASCEAVCDTASERYVATYALSKRVGILKNNLERLKLEHPDIYDEYASTTQFRKFTIRKEG